MFDYVKYPPANFVCLSFINVFSSEKQFLAVSGIVNDFGEKQNNYWEDARKEEL